MKAFALFLALAAASTASSLSAEELGDAGIRALPPALRSHVIKSAAECAKVDDGLLTVAAAALTRPDLDRDGDPDWILGEAGFSCSTSLTLFCGASGYCGNLVAIDDHVEWIGARAVEVLEAEDHTILLAWVPGDRCDGITATPCARAHVWDGTRWTTVGMAE